MDVITLALAKKYTEETVKGGGALKGANCTIKSIEAVPEGNKVTFEWTLTDGSKKTDFIIIKDGVDGKDGKDGIDGIDSEKGDKGDQGDKGIGIESITKKSSAGLVDTYQIVFTDGTESSFDVVNGANITKTSQLENDSNFITNVVNNLLNYYTKDEVYTKANIDELLRNVGAGLSVKIVAVLPTEEISGTTIYLIKTTGNNYNQYMWIDNAWANLGSTTVDLSNYYTKDKVDEILLGYVTKDVLASVLIDYVKKSELAKVATSNDYNDLDNLPEIPDVSGIKPYTDTLQDSSNTAPTSKALYDAVQTVNEEVGMKANSTDLNNYANKTDIPTSLPANGGNANTVNNHTVKSDVPENAVFTDTVYDDTEIKAEISKKADKSYVDDNFATMNKVDNIPLIYNQNTDILAYALTCPQEKRTLVRIYSANATNNPYGVSTATDFIYEIDKINFNDLFITVRAKDVKNNREFINTKNETKWSGWKELATMDKVANSIIRESKSVLYNLNNVDNIEVAIDIAKSEYKPIAVSLYNAGTHLWFAQGMYFNDTVCNLSLRGVTPTSATNAECKVLVTYIKTS